ncbi:GntR family transcriptional regulator [Streptoalloteichus hindustanus]|uniref:DNA-binding transcriptional regulator, GntR family n=1 Tax=Streptoalloteichus hindustanus TaxID=2017 RepID=A0A1M5H300_STRHI|nr:GntR family transcriptional regulator [Streptoalloteichus hindustanus]SHG10266.1 DNA-binding transcriptional regulator, GntR family [Streptoalloteichus hindustanus]
MVEAPIPRAEPLREAVYTRIAGMIARGELAPGCPVTEATLTRQLGVSRTPVREALLRLEAEGVLQSALARGFAVRPLDGREAAELYPILGTLEALAVREAELDSVDLPTLTELAEDLARSEDPVRRWQLDTAFHDGLVDAAHNARLSALTRTLRTNLSRYELAYMREVSRRERSDEQHRGILAAIRKGDREGAAQLVTANWADSLSVILSWLS